MSSYVWATRCIPAFSICAVAVLLVLALVVQPYGREEEGKHNGETTWAQLVLSWYTVLLHIMSIAFPLRVCWSMIDMIRRMRDANASMPSTRRPPDAMSRAAAAFARAAGPRTTGSATVTTAPVLDGVRSAALSALRAVVTAP